MKKFSDFASEERRLEGAKEKIDNLLNKEIQIITFTIGKSKYSKNNSGKYATVQYRENDNSPHIFFTGSDVLISQLEKYKQNMSLKMIGSNRSLTKK